MKNIFTLLVFFLFNSVLCFAQTDSIKIQTSAVCETCKKTLEHNLSFEKGVRKSSLDLDTKVITVYYNPEKTDGNKIREAVSKSGYEADSLKADSKAFNRLPECCRDPRHIHNE